MAQNNKPHRRTARDAGLSGSRTRYTVPNEKKKLPVVPIALVAACVAVAGALVATGNVPGLSGNQPTEMAVQQQDDANQDSKAAAESSAQKDDSKATSSDAKGTKKDASSKKGSDSASASSKKGSSSSEKSEGTSATARYADEQASKTQAEDDDSNWQDGDNGSNAATASENANGSSSAGSSSQSSGTSAASTAGSTSKNTSLVGSKGYSKLEKYYKKLVKQSDLVADFAEDVYNSHLFSSYKVRKADHKKLKELKSRILDVLVDSDGSWSVESADVSSKLKKTKRNLSKASDLLLKRLQVLDGAYRKINALGKKATNRQIDKASTKALKNSNDIYVDYTKCIGKVDAVLG